MIQVDSSALKLPRLERLSLSAWLTVLVFSCVLGCCALVLAQKFLQIPPSYPSFTVGAITWEGAGKFQDLASYPAFLVALIGSGLAMYRLLAFSARINTPDETASLVSALLWLAVPASMYAAIELTNRTAGNFLLALAAGGMLTLAVSYAVGRIHGPLRIQSVAMAILAVLLLHLAPFGLFAINDRFLHLDLAARLAPLIQGGSRVILLAGLIAVFLVCLRMPARLPRVVSGALLVGQLCVSPLFFLLYPDLRVGQIPAIQTTGWLTVLLSALTLLGCADTVRRFIRFGRGPSPDLSQCLSPLALFATLIAFRLGQTTLPHVVPDDYHFGESLLGWWSLREFGAIPYLDIISPHGIFADDFAGYLSMLFYDGTASSIPEADRLATSLTLLVAYLTLCRYTRSIGIAYVSMLLFGLIARKLFFLLLVPFFCLWLGVPRVETLRFRIITWLLTAPALILLVPPQGLLAVISSVPAFLYCLTRREARTLITERLWLAVAAVGLLIVMVASPIPGMMWSAIRYVLENGPINQIAYGIPWSWSQSASNGLLLEIFRMSWVLIPVTAGVLAVACFSSSDTRAYLLTVALPILIFVSLMTPYSLGRIDPGAPSRAGLLSNFAWAGLMPLLLAPILAKSRHALLALSIAFISSGIGLVTPSREALADVLTDNRIAPEQAQNIPGLDNLGTGSFDSAHVDRLRRVRRILDAHLPPRAPYLDLTGRNAHYFYFDRPAPIPVSAPYNLAPVKQQLRAVRQLSTNPPALALLDAANQNHDGGGLPLRSPLLYRFVLDYYEAELHDGFIFGVAHGQRVTASAISFTVKDISDPNWDHGIHRAEPALIVNDGLTLELLKVGDSIRLPNGDLRQVTRLWPEGRAIWLTGKKLSPTEVPLDTRLFVQMDEARRSSLSIELLNRAFATSDLKRIPASWGKSAGSLSHLMKATATPDLAKANLNDLVREGSSFSVSGSDPYLWFDLQPQTISGAQAALLSFRFSCSDQQAEPRAQVFWWGDEHTGATEKDSIRFTLHNGQLIVPLDANPGLARLRNLHGLRIDIEPAESCRKFELEQVGLMQRVEP